MKKPLIDMTTGENVDGGGRSSFLMKKGLTRDKAMYVTLLIEMRGRLDSLKKLARDSVVREDIEGMSFEIGETIDYMYAMSDAQKKGYGE